MNRKTTGHTSLFAALFILGVLPLFGCSKGIVHSGQTNFQNTISYALPKGYIHIINQAAGITVQTDYEADQGQYYLLEYTTNIGFDDNVTVSTNAKGLLESVNATTTSQVPGIIQNLAAIPLAAMRITTRGEEPVPNFDLVLDPIDIKEYNPKTFAETQNLLEQTKTPPRGANINERMEAYNVAKNRLSEQGGDLYKNFGITHISLEHPRKSFLYTDPFQSSTETLPADNRGICYRPGLPFRLRLLIQNNYWEQIVYLPNYSKLVTFDISRPAFVQKVQNLTFTNGMLTQVSVNKNSELLAALGIPAGIVKSVAGLPMDLITVKTTDLTTQTALINAQAALIQAQQALKQAQHPTTAPQSQ